MPGAAAASVRSQGGKPGDYTPDRLKSVSKVCRQQQLSQRPDGVQRGGLSYASSGALGERGRFAPLVTSGDHTRAGECCGVTSSAARSCRVRARSAGGQDLKRGWKKVEDRIFYDDILPPTGSQQISYARMMMLLGEKRVKRITLLSDGKIAIVEVTTPPSPLPRCPEARQSKAS